MQISKLTGLVVFFTLSVRICLVSSFQWIFEMIFRYARKNRRRVPVQSVRWEALTQQNGKSAEKPLKWRY